MEKEETIHKGGASIHRSAIAGGGELDGGNYIQIEVLMTTRDGSMFVMNERWDKTAGTVERVKSHALLK